MFNKHLSNWKWRVLVPLLSVLLLSMASYGLFDSADIDQRGGMIGRLGVSASLPACRSVVARGIDCPPAYWWFCSWSRSSRFFLASALSRRHWAGSRLCRAFAKAISQPLIARLHQRSRKAEAQQPYPNLKLKKPTKKQIRKQDGNQC